MINNAIGLATKGFIGGGPYKWFILEIQQEVVKKRRGGGYTEAGIPYEKNTYVTIRFEYDGKEYIQRKHIDKDINVKANMLTLELIDNEPKVNIILDDDSVIVTDIKPKANIIIDDE